MVPAVHAPALARGRTRPASWSIAAESAPTWTWPPVLVVTVAPFSRRIAQALSSCAQVSGVSPHTRPTTSPLTRLSRSTTPPYPAPANPAVQRDRPVRPDVPSAGSRRTPATTPDL